PVDAAAGAVGKEAIVASPTGRGNPLTAPLSRLRYPDRAMRPCPSGDAWTSRPPGPSARGRLGGLLLDERALEHVLPGHADPRRGDKTAPIEQRAEVGQHLRAAADHRAVVLRVQRLDAELLHHRAGRHHVGHAPALVVPAVLERLARHRREVQQLARNYLAEELVPRQLVLDVVAIGRVLRVAHAVAQDDQLAALVGFRVLDVRQPRREAGARAQQVQIAARVEVVDQQGAGGLAADQYRVARLDVLQAGGERAIGHLDAEELQLLLPVGAGDG